MADDPGDGVKGEQLLLEFAVFVDAELDTVAGKQLVNGFAVLNESIHRLLPPKINEKGAFPLFGKSAFTFHTAILSPEEKVVNCRGSGQNAEKWPLSSGK